ncbi:hypothetical protein [Cohnella lupini]|uniref:Uncharacterized protein n=1 Tax=Cohnella lupini TaxID=1294267 RepID=A0A3D9IVI0_9BACL|nr:hypothetical protein [Cohnella lupini]RED65711.1 hypothetical protein DFP95_101200 [Cohnella lupini]
MSDNVQRKRSYAAPVLFVIMVVLVTMIIMAYSKYLLTRQTHTTDQGQQLSEQYKYALIFANRLHEGSEGFLNARNEAEKLRAARMLGEASIASTESLELFAEAELLSNGKSDDDNREALTAAMNAVIGPDSLMASIGEHEGPLTDEEKATLTVVRDGAERMRQSLSRFRPPSGEAGYRQMMTIGEWIPSANQAGVELKALSAQL